MRKTLCTLALLSLSACDWHYNPTQPDQAPATPIAYFPKDSVSLNAYPPRFAPRDSIQAERAFDSLLALWPTTYGTSAHCTAKRSQWYVGAFRKGYETPTRNTLSGWMDAEAEGDPSTFCFSYNIHE